MGLRGGACGLMHQVLARSGDALLFHTDFVVRKTDRKGLAVAERIKCCAPPIPGAADLMTPPRAARDIAAALKAKVHTVNAGHVMLQGAPDATFHAMRHARAWTRPPLPTRT